jgi:predicted RNA-binding Zn ribbon-like protein
VDFAFVSGNPALDYVGTLKWRRTEPLETLLAVPDLCEWLRRAGVLTEVTAADETSLDQARALREAVYDVITAQRSGTPWPADAVAELNAAAARPGPRLVLDAATGRAQRLGDVSAGMAALARAAIELVTGPDAALLKECARSACTRVFLDQSRGGRRTWCGMDECGNRVKAAAYRARKRAATPGR